MEFAASKYCIKWENYCIFKDCFIETNIRVNILSAKACFLKLKIDTQLTSNLSKTAKVFFLSVLFFFCCLFLFIRFNLYLLFCLNNFFSLHLNITLVNFKYYFSSFQACISWRQNFWTQSFIYIGCINN